MKNEKDALDKLVGVMIWIAIVILVSLTVSQTTAITALEKRIEILEKEKMK